MRKETKSGGEIWMLVVPMRINEEWDEFERVKKVVMPMIMMWKDMVMVMKAVGKVSEEGTKG